MKWTALSLVIYMTIFAILISGHYNCKMLQFIFGDCISDVGNNNYLSESLARASLPWYCRFSNCLTLAVMVGYKMGFQRTPAFFDLSLTEEVILENGVNYASEGGGILNEIGSYFVS
ncbi:unnamed protein product [Fraxinus pennsylvanica]|uniref:Uncharacterized protein n=1 Tax=Fraxinus pennsylvanica TaxID=56036 RepID=A0AAD1ZCG9_9LAMI|nr:unnamed protein product [Fraxinus pennsylvanica]